MRTVLQRLRFVPYGIAVVVVLLVVRHWVRIVAPLTVGIAVLALAVSALLGLDGALRLATRVGKIAAGVLLILAGIVMLVIPGPGLLAIAAGLGLLATQSPWLQRRLHAGYVRLPAKIRRHTPKLITRIVDPAPGTSPSPSP